MTTRILSIIVPVYNEERTVVRVLDALAALHISDWRFEIIVVDDGSCDKTAEKITSWMDTLPRGHDVYVVRHSDNLGKGAAIRSGLGHATGDAVLIQDADLEYDSTDIPRLVNALGEGVDAVFGSRNLAPTGRGYWHYVMGVRILTWLANMRYGSNLTDLYTGYKLVRTDVLHSCRLTANGFEFEAEVVAELLARGAHICEVPVSYAPRTFDEGKKIRAWDACIGVWILFLPRGRARHSVAKTRIVG